MEGTAKKAFQLLRKIKSVTFATVNSDSPDAQIDDIMLAEDDGVYFTTVRGKPYYRQLQAHRKPAICGMNAKYVTVRLTGEIRQCRDRRMVDKIFEQNPMMDDLYPGISQK